MVRKFLLMIIMVALIVLPIAREEKKAVSKLPTGVKLIYRATWMGMRAGTGIIQIGAVTKRGKQDVIPVSSCIRTSSLVNVFYKIDDCMSSLLDSETLFPYWFEERIREGSYKRDKVIEFDRQKGLAKVFSRQNGNLILDEELPIEGDFHDFLSWTFFMSTQELRVGQIFKFKVLTSGGINVLDFKVSKKESVSIPNLGEFQAFQIVPSTETRKAFKNGETGEVWVDSDNRRPLILDFKIPVAGFIRLTLEKVERESP